MTASIGSLEGPNTEVTSVSLPASQKLKKRSAVIASIFGTLSMLSITGTTVSTLVISVTHQITTAAATALIVKCLGLAALGAAGSLAIYGIPLVILIVSIIALCCINNDDENIPGYTANTILIDDGNNKNKMIQDINYYLEHQGIEQSTREQIIQHLALPEITENQVSALLSQVKLNPRMGKKLLDALDPTDANLVTSPPRSLSVEESIAEGLPPLKRVIAQREEEIENWLAQTTPENITIFEQLITTMALSRYEAMQRILNPPKQREASNNFEPPSLTRRKLRKQAYQPRAATATLQSTEARTMPIAHI